MKTELAGPSLKLGRRLGCVGGRWATRGRQTPSRGAKGAGPGGLTVSLGIQQGCHPAPCCTVSPFPIPNRYENSRFTWTCEVRVASFLLL